MRKIILASGSPRRKELMKESGYDFEVIVSNAEEVLDESLEIKERIENIAYQKAQAVFKEHDEAIVIGADTVVVCDNQILGKPHNRKQGYEMLKMLENKSHEVITGMCFISKEEIYKWAEVSTVYFGEIVEEDLQTYLESEEPYDKAGGYAIQGWAKNYIYRFDGDYNNVVGMPVKVVKKYLQDYEARFDKEVK